MIINSLDLGGRPARLAPTAGQVIGNAIVAGSRTTLWPTAAAVSQLDVEFWISAWQALGGQAANSLAANRLLRNQLKEFSLNPDLPAYVQWAQTTQTNPAYVARTDPDDGWFLLQNLTWDPESYNQQGSILARATFQAAAEPPPSGTATAYAGAGLSSTYSAAPVPLVAFPLGATGQPPTTGSRTGGEGAVPFSTSPVPTPVPWVPSATIANLFKGGLHVYDTVTTGGNAVPVAGGVFLNANWVEVFGPTHDFTGDCVLTNGLLLLLCQTGVAHACSLYLWNTSLGTPTWQLQATLDYADNATNAGTLRTIDLDRLSMEEVRLRLRLNTSTGSWALLKLKLQRGRYDCYVEFWPLTQTPSNLNAVALTAASAYVTAFTDTTSQTVFPASLATTTVSGYAAVQGSASGSPILGWFFQNIPGGAIQGRAESSTLFGYGGDGGAPGVGTGRLYGFFAVPYSGAVVLATARGIVAPIFQQYLFDKSLSWVRG